MAGFRIGRGRNNNRTPQQPPQQHQQPYGQQQPPQPYGRQPYPPAGPPPQQQWPDAGGHGEPEYFDPYQQQAPYGHGGGGYSNDNPGHTQVFAVGEDPYGQGATYQAGGRAAAAPSGPRLPWKELLRGIVTRPGQTFHQMRDHAVWGPALTVTFLYGLLAVFGFDDARQDVIKATLSKAVPIVLTTGVAFLICGLVLGAVTHTLARQLGGDGTWQPTVGLSMLVMSLTDAPRLIFAVFLGGDNGLVQVLGWATWIAAGFLFTALISKVHDLPWPKALGASAIQLVALLSIIKLGTI